MEGKDYGRKKEEKQRKGRRIDIAILRVRFYNIFFVPSTRIHQEILTNNYKQPRKSHPFTSPSYYSYSSAID